VGVARQYCGTLGKRGNCQIGVFLGYASPKGHAGLDRALYLPRGWTEDAERCRAVGVPDGAPFQTKPQLASALVKRALDAGVPAAWVAGDEVYGGDSKFRLPLEDRGQGYVLAVRRNQPISTWPPYGAPNQWTVAEYAATIPAEAWQRLSCGAGAQGPRLYDWAYRPARPATHEPPPEGQPWAHGLLVRRHPERPDELAFYLVYAPPATSLEELARAAGARWTIDDIFKLAKGQVGLDQYEVRSWRGWYRHITLALLAFAALTVAARQKRGPPPPARSTSPSPSPKPAASWSASSGSSPTRRPAQAPSPPGPAGAAATRKSPRTATFGAG